MSNEKSEDWNPGGMAQDPPFNPEGILVSKCD